jgi:periplasmic protein TonB
MEAKKTDKADLTKKSFLFFNIGLVASLLISITAFTYKVYDDTSAKDLTTAKAGEDEIMEVPPTEQLPPPPPKIQQPQIVEVPDEKEIEEDIDISMDNEVTQETKVEEIAIQPQEEKENVDEIFNVVEESASPNGGMSAFYEYVGKKLQGKYPAQARRMGIEGKVFVEFVVNRDGSIQDVRAIKGIGGGCDELATKIIQESPAWKPGKQRGKPVRQKMVLPIVFKLS